VRHFSRHVFDRNGSAASFSLRKQSHGHPRSKAKLGIWPDAYYASFNIFAPSFSGSMACAYDRTNMLAGNPATTICLQQPKSVGSLLPS
jgi:hypothetical protein